MRLFTRPSKLFGRATYCGERYADGKVCRKYEYDANVYKAAVDFYANIFKIINRAAYDFSLKSASYWEKFIVSPEYKKMWDFFMGGLHLNFKESGRDFEITANHSQFYLKTNGDTCHFVVRGNEKFKSIDPEFYNFHDCDLTLPREQGELFLAALATKLRLEFSNTPVMSITNCTLISSLDNLYLIGLTNNIHSWYKGVAYEALRR